MGDSGWGAALRAARQARGVSLRGLQALVSYDFTYLGQVERGEKPGSRELAERCDRALGTGGSLAAAYASGTPEPVSPQGEPPRPAAAPLPGAGPETCASACAAAAAGRVGAACETGCRALPGPGTLTRLVAENRHDLARPRTGREHGRLLAVRSDLALLAGRAALLDLRDTVSARGWLTMARETAVELRSDARATAAAAHLAVVAASEDRTDVAAGYLATARRHAARTGLPVLGPWLDALRPDAVRGTGGRAADALAEAGTTLERPCTATPGPHPDAACPAGVRPAP